MRINLTLRSGLFTAAAFLLLPHAPLTRGTVLAAQRTASQTPQLPPTIQTDPAAIEAPSGPPDPMRARMDEDRRKALNDDRHKRLAADVDKLIALTTELKSDVDKTTKDELSLEVIKKAQEIEKLAHDVQSRMKN